MKKLPPPLPPPDVDAMIERRARELALFILHNDARVVYFTRYSRRPPVAEIRSPQGQRLRTVPGPLAREAEALLDAFEPEPVPEPVVVFHAAEGQHRERTAYHEAGHALAGIILGFGIVSASIVPEGDSNGRVVKLRPLTDFPLDSVAVFAAAGMAAECLVFGTHAWGGQVPTTPERVATATDPAVWFTGEREDTSDASALCTLARAAGATDPAEVRARVEAWILDACDLLDKVRGDLTDLAAALLEYGTLDAPGILAVFEGDPPAPLNA